jgi:hypothetical protein
MKRTHKTPDETLADTTLPADVRSAEKDRMIAAWDAILVAREARVAAMSQEEFAQYLAQDGEALGWG